MKVLLCVVAIASLFSGVSLAEAPSTQPAEKQELEQRRGGPRRGGGGGLQQGILQRARGILEELDLSAEQRTQINDIFTRAREEMQSLRQDMQDSDLLPREQFQRMRDTMDKYRQEVLGVLSDEQKAAFEAQLDAWRNGPATRPGAGGRPPIGTIMDRIERIADELNLTDAQKAQIGQILAESREKLEQLRDEVEESGQRVRGQFRELMQETRKQVSDVLTEEQRAKLQELMPNLGQGPGGRDRGRGPRNRDRGGDKPDQPQKNSADDADKPAEIEALPPPEDDAGAAVGDKAPEFSLRKLDGLPVQLSSFRGRLLVIEFGSYTSPSFRDRAAEMEQLRKDFNARVNFLIVYTREAHAKGQWDVERNQDDGIAIAQPTDHKERAAVAKEARDALKISIPIAIDDLSDSVATAYEGMSNAAVIIDRDGTIAYRQSWCDPAGLRRKLTELLTTRPATQPT